MESSNRKGLSSRILPLLALLCLISSTAYSQDSRPRYSSSRVGRSSWTIPEGTIISLRMNRTLDSKTSRVGDRFAATVTIPVYVDGTPVIPAGAMIEGRVTEVVPAKRMSRPGTIAVDFDELILPNGWHTRVVGSLTSDDPEARRTIDEEGQVSGENSRRPGIFVGGGGAIGAILGGIAGGGKGAVIGGVAGAGAGVAGILLSKGEEAQVPSGTPFGIQLKQPLVITDASASDPAAVADEPAASSAGNDERIADRRSPDPPERTERPDTDARPDIDRNEARTPSLPLNSPEMTRRAQAALRDQGYYEGEIDGQMSARTSSALRTFQREHNLPETGNLDPASAKALGILGSSAAGDVAEPREPSDVDPGDRDDSSSTSGEAELANVISAIANRSPNGTISVVINTQANTGGWRWFGEHVVNGDTLEVYARAVRPRGMVTQALTRGRIELNVDQDVEYVRRVIVHGASGDLAVPLRSTSNTGRTPENTSAPIRTPGNLPSSVNLPRQAEELLFEYQRMIGARVSGTSIEFDRRVRHDDQNMGLLFALDSFVNAAQLYSRMLPSLQDRASVRGATLALAREARRTDAFLTTTSNPSTTSLTARWEAIRQHVLSLMQAQGIRSSELEF